MSQTYSINTNTLTIREISELIQSKNEVVLSDTSKEAISRCRQFLDEKLKTNRKPIYGINTGFGSLYNVSISKNNLSKLQENLVMSHACGTGNKVPGAL